MIGLALERLGGEITQRADHVAGIRQVVAARQLRQAEVGDPGDLVLVDQDVRRLDVAVQDALVVRVIEGLRRLDADPGDESPVVGAVRRAVAPPGLEHPVEALAPDVLHRVIRQPVVLAGREDRHDVGVVELSDGLRLALEPLAALGVEQPVPGDDLEGDVAAERLLDRFINDPHAAAAQLADDPVLVQPLEAGLVEAGLGSDAAPTDRLSCSIMATEGRSSRILPA